MEEVRASSTPEDGQPSGELPEPLNIPHEPQPTPPNPYEPIPPSRPIPQEQAPSPNTSSLRNSNLEATYDINTLPRPVEVDSLSYPEQVPNQEVPEIHEAEFDKRNERLRDVPRQQDELAAAGMVALGDVLKDRQTAYATQPNPVPRTPRSAPPPLTPPVNSMGTGWSLYKQAIAVGITAALIIAPIIILIVS